MATRRPELRAKPFDVRALRLPVVSGVGCGLGENPDAKGAKLVRVRELLRIGEPVTLSAVRDDIEQPDQLTAFEFRCEEIRGQHRHSLACECRFALAMLNAEAGAFLSDTSGVGYARSDQPDPPRRVGWRDQRKAQQISWT